VVTWIDRVTGMDDDECLEAMVVNCFAHLSLMLLSAEIDFFP
jgi:hypothetical protein